MMLIDRPRMLSQQEYEDIEPMSGYCLSPIAWVKNGSNTWTLNFLRNCAARRPLGEK